MVTGECVEDLTRMDINWNYYTNRCREMAAPAIDRFENSLLTACRVATAQSMPVYSGAMKASLITVHRDMVELLKRSVQVAGTGAEEIRWNVVSDRMREAFFLRLGEIKNMEIAREYVRVRIRKLPPQKDLLFQWVTDLSKDEQSVKQLCTQVRKAAAAFASFEVPKIMDEFLPQ